MMSVNSNEACLYLHKQFRVLRAVCKERVFVLQCFCRDCTVDVQPAREQSPLDRVAAIKVENVLIRPGDTVKCLHHTARPQSDSGTAAAADDGQNDTSDADEQDESVVADAVLLNAMLWPTVLFIGGFVGLFFACIQLAHDRQASDFFIAPDDSYTHMMIMS